MAMRGRMSILFLVTFLFLAGCTQPPLSENDHVILDENSFIDNNSIGTSPVGENPIPPITVEKWPEKFVYTLTDENDSLLLQNDSPNGLLYSKKDYCIKSYCVLGIILSQPETFSIPVEIISEKYPVLFQNDYLIKNERRVISFISLEETNQQCLFHYLKTDEKYMKEFGSSFSFVCDHISALEEMTGLPPKKGFVIIWETDLFHAGEYWGNNILWLSKQAKFGMTNTIFHEMMHAQTEGMYLPTWFSEGIAEYYSYQITGSPFTPVNFADGLEEWKYSPTSWTEATTYYESAHSAIIHFVEKYGEEKLREVLQYYYEHPFDPPVDEDDRSAQRASLLKTLRTITGDNALLHASDLFVTK